MGAIVAFANQKGGVGKTTSAVNIAAALGKMGKKVLLVDMDPQGNATSGVGISKKEIRKSIYEVLIGTATAEEAVIVTKFKNLSVIPSNIALVGAEIDLLEVEKREACAKRALETLRAAYDYIFIDCPPALSMLTVNAFVAADGLIIPMQCEYYALEGLSQLTRTIQGLKKFLNPTITIEGIILTMYDKRSNLTSQVFDEIKKFFGEKLYDSVIPRNVRLAEAPSYGQPIIIYDKNCKGSKAFKALATEFLQKQ